MEQIYVSIQPIGLFPASAGRVSFNKPLPPSQSHQNMAFLQHELTAVGI